MFVDLFARLLKSHLIVFEQIVVCTISTEIKEPLKVTLQHIVLKRAHKSPLLIGFPIVLGKLPAPWLLMSLILLLPPNHLFLLSPAPAIVLSARPLTFAWFSLVLCTTPCNVSFSSSLEAFCVLVRLMPYSLCHFICLYPCRWIRSLMHSSFDLTSAAHSQLS